MFVCPFKVGFDANGQVNDAEGARKDGCSSAQSSKEACPDGRPKETQAAERSAAEKTE